MGSTPYPEKIEFELGEYPQLTVFDRYQVVIPCFDKEQADRISGQVAKFCGHYVERLYGLTRMDGEPTILSETVMERKSVGVDLEGLEIPADDDGEPLVPVRPGARN